MRFNEDLAELFELAKCIHLYVVFIIAALILVHFCLVNFNVNSPSYAKKIKLFLPAYYSFLAVIALTGLLLMSVFYFTPNIRSTTMIAAFFLLIGFGAMEFKWLKRAITNKNFTDFRKKARIKIEADFILILIASGIR